MVCVLGVANAGVVASDADGVFERYRHAGQRACLLVSIRGPETEGVYIMEDRYHSG